MVASWLVVLVMAGWLVCSGKRDRDEEREEIILFYWVIYKNKNWNVGVLLNELVN